MTRGPAARDYSSTSNRMEIHMCRWLAYSGSPVLIEDLLYRPQHSLIDQSLHSRLGAETTNGDGFGIGWYGIGNTPGLFRSIEPAWNDRNLHEIAQHIQAPIVFAHIRASSGTPIQQTNCHPFRHGRWLWMHNGMIREFHELKRDLVLAVDPSLYPEIEGSSDSEVFFHLALTFGLEDDPPAAVAAAVGLIEQIGHDHGVENPIQMTVATTNGEHVWGFRYSSERDSRTLFYSTSVPTLRKLHPDLEILNMISDTARLIVSEPLRDLSGAWNEVPESSYGFVGGDGHDELHPFVPTAPAHATAVPTAVQ
jgi:predicted glutamine amidotransferase